MITDELWPGGPMFRREDDTFRLGTDSVLVSSFASTNRVKRACDLGCGTGIIAILLALKSKTMTVDGVELQPDWAKLARENAMLSCVDDRINIITGDLRQHREFLKAGHYDLVISNPPYYACGNGKSSKTDSKATAREERTCTLNDLCAAASYLTRWGGHFALVHKPERLGDIFSTLKNNGFEPKRLRFVQFKAEAAPNLMLIESRRGGKPSLTVEAPLIMTDAFGFDSEEIKMIYHRN